MYILNPKEYFWLLAVFTHHKITKSMILHKEINSMIFFAPIVNPNLNPNLNPNPNFNPNPNSYCKPKAMLTTTAVKLCT